jgi:hypothetical protein
MAFSFMGLMGISWISFFELLPTKELINMVAVLRTE